MPELPDSVREQLERERAATQTLINRLSRYVDTSERQGANYRAELEKKQRQLADLETALAELEPAAEEGAYSPESILWASLVQHGWEKRGAMELARLLLSKKDGAGHDLLEILTLGLIAKGNEGDPAYLVQIRSDPLTIMPLWSGTYAACLERAKEQSGNIYGMRGRFGVARLDEVPQ